MKKYDVIVVGGGISGLLSSLALSKEGKKVLILEKNKFMGGNVRTYDVNGYKVDTGPHAITGLSDGPLIKLINSYFNISPKFIPYGDYYIRSRKSFIKFPWTIQSWARFNILSMKDRLLITQAMIESSSKFTFRKKTLDVSTYKFLQNYNFSQKAWKFIDSISYFLTGVSMKESPAWRMLNGGGYISEETNGIKKHLSKFIKLARYSGGVQNHGYPKGGIQSIILSILHSFPKSVEIKLSTEVKKIVIEDNKVHSVETENDVYYAETIVYSAPVKNLPKLISNLPKEYSTQLNSLRQATTLTIWIGLSRKIPEFNYTGSEIGFEGKASYWAMPTSNYDPSLAPNNKQLIGFTSIPKGNVIKHKKKLLDTIYHAIPSISDYMEFEHVQITNPEKAAITIDTKLPSPKTYIDGLYLVGTDTDYRCMGITKAAFSVLEVLKFMREDRII
jgi:phytoene dehydrogenase-like protein